MLVVTIEKSSSAKVNCACKLFFSKSLTPSEMYKLGLRVTGKTGQAKLKVSKSSVYQALFGVTL